MSNEDKSSKDFVGFCFGLSWLVFFLVLALTALGSGESFLFLLCAFLGALFGIPPVLIWGRPYLRHPHLIRLEIKRPIDRLITLWRGSIKSKLIVLFVLLIVTFLPMYVAVWIVVGSIGLPEMIGWYITGTHAGITFIFSIAAAILAIHERIKEKGWVRFVLEDILDPIAPYLFIGGGSLILGAPVVYLIIHVPEHIVGGFFLGGVFTLTGSVKI